MVQASLPPRTSTNPPNTTTASLPRSWWVVLRLCNVSVCLLILLTIAVVVMGIQLQYVSYQVKEQQSALTALQVRVQNQTFDEIEVLQEKVDEEHSLTIYHMAGTFCLLACLITSFHMSIHLRNYHQPMVQRKVVAILWMSPIYAVTSFVSLLVPVVEGYLEVIKDFYEAYCIYTFLSFLIAVLGKGDREAAVQVLSRRALDLKNPTRFLSHFYHPPPETSAQAKANAVVVECLILTMQFVFLRPLTSIAGFVILTLKTKNGSDPDAHFEEYFTSPAFFIAMITNVSVFLAFTGLIKFYHAVSQDLKWCQPFPKFMAIKGIVFLTFWQGLVILVGVQIHTGGNDDTSEETPRERATAIQNILICLEMLFFSIAHWCVFPPEEWEPEYRPQEQRAKPGIGLSDFASDMKLIMSSRSQARQRRRLNSNEAAQQQEKRGRGRGGRQRLECSSFDDEEPDFGSVLGDVPADADGTVETLVETQVDTEASLTVSAQTEPTGDGLVVQPTANSGDNVVEDSLEPNAVGHLA